MGAGEWAHPKAKEKLKAKGENEIVVCVGTCRRPQLGPLVMAVGDDDGATGDGTRTGTRAPDTTANRAWLRWRRRPEERA